MPRQNLCTNPKAQNDVTGFQQSGADAPAQATGLSGFPSDTTAAQWTTGTYQTTSTGAAAEGDTVIVSFYARSVTSAQSNKDLYINWILASGSSQPTSVKVSLAANTVTRVSISATAPANTVAAGALIDGMNASLSTIQFSDVLIEAGSTLNDYADGDTSGWAWDGTTGSSSSSESAVTPDAIAPDGLALSLSLGAPAVAQDLTVAPTTLALPLGLGAPVLSSPGLVITPGGISLPFALGAPVATQDLSIAPDALAIALTLGAPAVGDAFHGEVIPDAVVLAVGLGEPSVRFVPPDRGGWEQLRGIVAEARADHVRNQERIANPIDCPEHGWPLQKTSRGLHCEFGGHIVGPGDRVRDYDL